MIKPDSNYMKGLPEQYFTIPEDEKVDPNTSGLALYRIEVIVDLLFQNESSDKEITEVISFILEGMVYQDKELAGGILDNEWL